MTKTKMRGMRSLILLSKLCLSCVIPGLRLTYLQGLPEH